MDKVQKPSDFLALSLAAFQENVREMEIELHVFLTKKGVLPGKEPPVRITKKEKRDTHPVKTIQGTIFCPYKDPEPYSSVVQTSV
jgi:hypothetical protein